MQNAHMETKLPLYRSIRGQLIVWFLLLGLIPLIVMGSISFVNADNALEDSISNTLQGLAHAKAVELETWLADTGRMARALAAMGGLSGAEGVDNMGLQVIASTRNRGDDAGRYQNAYGTALLAMNAFKNVYTRVDDAFLIDSNGIIQVSTNQDLIRDGTRVADIPNIDFEAGLQGTQVGDIVQSIDGVSRIFMVVTPVISYNGTTIGVLAVRINLDMINRITSDFTGLGETGEQYLVNLEDRLMRTPSRFGDVDFVNQRIDTRPVEQTLAGIDEVTEQYIDYRGVQVLGTWERIEGSNWLLVVEIDIDEAFEPVTALGNTILIIVAIAVVVILAVSIWIAISISRPIVTISQAASRVAGGALEERVNIRNRNEIGVLGSAFNQMTANLRQMVEAEREGKAQLEATVTQYSQFIETVAQGNLTEKLQLNGSNSGQEDLRRLGDNLNMMVDNLREMAVQINDTVTSLSSTVTQIQAAT
ncbi:MAG: cache domain-containing protein, partial [Phototrophicaceae bacterium]